MDIDNAQTSTYYVPFNWKDGKSHPIRVSDTKTGMQVLIKGMSSLNTIEREYLHGGLLTCQASNSNGWNNVSNPLT